MGIRTDLAVESKDFKKTDGYYCEKNGDFELHFAEISKNNAGEKPSGKYVTLYFNDTQKTVDFEPLKQQFFKAMNCFNYPFERVLVAGLGNRDITADSIGPKTAEKILATRHITGDFAEKIGLNGLKNVAVIAPDVLGKTGFEVQEILEGIIKKADIDTVIVIDALCAKSESRLFKTIQLTDSGIAPGSGVKNSRKELSRDSLGVNVIAIGVPSVIEFPTDSENLIVTPKDCDILTDKLSEILAQYLNLFLQPNIDSEILLSLV